jgi:hypothetical protein
VLKFKRKTPVPKVNGVSNTNGKNVIALLALKEKRKLKK